MSDDVDQVARPTMNRDASFLTRIHWERCSSYPLILRTWGWPGLGWTFGNAVLHISEG